MNDETVVNDDEVMSDGSSSTESDCSKSMCETDTESSDDEILAKIARRNVGGRGRGQRVRNGRGGAGSTRC